MDRKLEQLKEQIKYRTELLKLAAFFTLALGGSSAGLMLGQLTLFRVCVALMGIAGAVLLLVFGWRQHALIQELIMQIGENHERT